jgi:hypothetical protein
VVRAQGKHRRCDRRRWHRETAGRKLCIADVKPVESVPSSRRRNIPHPARGSAPRKRGSVADKANRPANPADLKYFDLPQVPSRSELIKSARQLAK